MLHFQNFNRAITNATANSFISNPTALSITTGIYIVDAYCLFTPGSSANNNNILNQLNMEH